MKNKFLRTLTTALMLTSALSLSSCLGDLDQEPSYEPTVESVYKNPAQIKQVLARLYATLAVSGQQGPAGQPDIQGIDEGFSNYLRQYWMAQELTTDEAIIAWNDNDLPEYNRLTWTASNSFVRAMYDRLFYQISLCNEFLRQTTDERMAANGISGNDLTNIKAYRAEARFLRALAYYHALDMFGNVPFTDENSTVSTDKPVRITRSALFDYVENELKATVGDLAAPRANEYGRVDKTAAWMLLAKLYLNAPVYKSTTPGGTDGPARNADVIANCNNILNTTYRLSPSYDNLFRADNGEVAATAAEIIYPVRFDGIRTKTYGGMTFILHAAVGGSMPAGAFGLDGGWGGTRTKRNLVELFPGGATSADRRAQFYTTGQSIDVNDIFTFTDGYAVTKYRNLTSTGQQASNPTFPDNDFPLFRLADVYLMYGEATVRGGAGGDVQKAVDYVNALRDRAYGNTGGATAGHVDAATISRITNGQPEFFLDERGRELYWEAHRRTDLIRFGKYTSASYVWPFKGGVAGGTGVAATRTLFPIPTTDITANPNLQQNPGY